MKRLVILAVLALVLASTGTAAVAVLTSAPQAL
jgi:hypothetical protein